MIGSTNLTTLLMEKDCIFCQIMGEEVPSYKVYEDEHTFAFLDIKPINPGHILVIPKKHEPDFYKLDDESYMAVFNTVKKLSVVVEEKIKPTRVGLMIAGWDIPHVHVHIVPMHDYHDITSKSLIEEIQNEYKEGEAEEIAKEIREVFKK
jgi:histidine triad (HIT) family protein